ncbi:uncharacterized protein TrAtP1_003530 [Trichoderma atroviride]|uniref:uncharacterized protein n=1 Tax=Hypocrea atroviridis TaxID=63577 RepID=UPI0033181DA0|nr:hypothetical protein TrAtP1_003530 [Trichoderma atroviride]
MMLHDAQYSEANWVSISAVLYVGSRRIADLFRHTANGIDTPRQNGRTLESFASDTDFYEFGIKFPWTRGILTFDVGLCMYECEVAVLSEYAGIKTLVGRE